MSAAALLLVLAAAPAPAQEPAPVTGYELHFEGNTSVPSRELERAAIDELADLVRNGYRRADVDDAAFVMESWYRAQGWPDARVRYRTTRGDGLLVATFLVEEGPRCALGQVRVRGVHAMTREQVSSFLLPPAQYADGGTPWFVASQVSGAASSIRTAYWALGHLDVEVEPPELEFAPDRSSVEVLVRVREGVSYRVRRFQFEGVEQVPLAALEAVVEPLRGLPYYPRRAYEVRTAVHAVCANAGFPDAAVEVLPEPNPDTGAVRFTVRLVEGPQVRIRSVEVRGNDRTSTSFIRERVRMEPDELYSQRKEHASFRSLFETGLFARINFGLEGEGEVRTLAVQVEEALAKEFMVEPGYGSYEGARMELGFRERNLFGTGRQFRSEVELTQVGYSALGGYTDPWLLDSAISMDVPVYFRRRQEPSFTRAEVGAGIDLRHEFNDDFSLAGGVGLRRSNVSGVKVVGPAAGLTEDVDILSLRAEPTWDSRNDLFNPTRGALARLQLERGLDLWAGELEFVRARASFAQVLPLNPRETTLLAAGLRAGVIVPTGGTEEIPLQERFFNGGESSVRSFEEGELGPLDPNGQPLGGETFTTLNLELRQKLSSSLWGGLFVDAGNVGPTTADFFGDYRYGVGVGLRYLLPVGALRVDFGWNPDQRPVDESYQVFLSVGMAF